MRILVVVLSSHDRFWIYSRRGYFRSGRITVYCLSLVKQIPSLACNVCITNKLKVHWLIAHQLSSSHTRMSGDRVQDWMVVFSNLARFQSEVNDTCSLIDNIEQLHFWNICVTQTFLMYCTGDRQTLEEKEQSKYIYMSCRIVEIAEFVKSAADFVKSAEYCRNCEEKISTVEFLNLYPK